MVLHYFTLWALNIKQDNPAPSVLKPHQMILQFIVCIQRQLSVQMQELVRPLRHRREEEACGGQGGDIKCKTPVECAADICF